MATAAEFLGNIEVQYTLKLPGVNIIVALSHLDSQT
jgi:hypothetical protein